MKTLLKFSLCYIFTLALLACDAGTTQLQAESFGNDQVSKIDELILLQEATDSDLAAVETECVTSDEENSEYLLGRRGCVVICHYSAEGSGQYSTWTVQGEALYGHVHDTHASADHHDFVGACSPKL